MILLLLLYVSEIFISEEVVLRVWLYYIELFMYLRLMVVVVYMLYLLVYVFPIGVFQ